MLRQDLFKQNRNKFLKKMSAGGLALFHSNDQMPTNADGLMPFRQNNDLFYLTGIDQEESSLIMFHDLKKNIYKEILFIKKTNDLIKVWEGHKLTKEEAREKSGIESVIWNDEFDRILNNFIMDASCIYINTNEHPRAKVVVETRNARLNKKLIIKHPDKQFEKSANILHQIRSVKEKQELSCIKKACDITKRGFDRVLKFIKPGIFEYNIQAELIHEFINNNSKGFAYEPIIASGKNACILHYTDNNKLLNSGDLILMDFGAEFNNYASDLTRCVPVNGRFTERQKKVYNSVLRVMNEAKKLLTPGVYLSEYEKNVGLLMEKELVKLNLLSMNEIRKNSNIPAYKKYFMHGTSHHLGLDVHDVSDVQKPISEGMVFTCEPGIYIPEEGLGIRLENDVFITKNGTQDLMENIIIEAEEIEEEMNN